MVKLSLVHSCLRIVRCSSSQPLCSPQFRGKHWVQNHEGYGQNLATKFEHHSLYPSLFIRSSRITPLIKIKKEKVFPINQIIDIESESSEITLRLLDPSDRDDYMEIMRDGKVNKWCSWDSSMTKEAAMDYIIDFAVPHPFYRAICLQNRFVGSISVTPFRGNDSCRAELGYVVGSKHWGKGVATKAVEMVMKSIFIEWPHLERLEAQVDVENGGSQRVLEKAGFKKEGVMRKYWLLKGNPRDMIMFSVISSDQEPLYMKD